MKNLWHYKNAAKMWSPLLTPLIGGAGGPGTCNMAPVWQQIVMKFSKTTHDEKGLNIFQTKKATQNNVAFAVSGAAVADRTLLCTFLCACVPLIAR